MAYGNGRLGARKRPRLSVSEKRAAYYGHGITEKARFSGPIASIMNCKCAV
jgi:hypothetical protein